MLFRVVTSPNLKQPTDLYRFAAPIYDFATAVWSGGAIWRSRLACIEEMSEGAQVLIPGPGTGRLAVEAAERGGAVTAVERSSVMAQRFESRARGVLGPARFRAVDQVILPPRAPSTATGVHPAPPCTAPGPAPGTLLLIRGNMDAVPARSTFDLVVAEHFLNVFQPGEMAAMRDRLIDRVAPGGRFAIADFSPIPNSKPATLRALQRAHHVIPLGGCALLTRNALHPVYDHGAELSARRDLRLALKRDFRSFAVGPGWFRTWIFEKMVRDD